MSSGVAGSGDSSSRPDPRRIDTAAGASTQSLSPKHSFPTLSSIFVETLCRRSVENGLFRQRIPTKDSDKDAATRPLGHALETPAKKREETDRGCVRSICVVELVALRRVAPRAAAQRLPANRATRASRSAAARGGVVAARQPLPLNRYCAEHQPQRHVGHPFWDDFNDRGHPRVLRLILPPSRKA